MRRDRARPAPRGVRAPVASARPPGRPALTALVRQAGPIGRVAVLAFVLFVAGCATAPKSRVSLAGLEPGQAQRATHNLEVFNSVWDLVNRKHFDPRLQGLDWKAAGAQYGPVATAAPNDTKLYATLNTMLGALHDSHTHALMPTQVVERKTRLRARTGFNMVRIEGRWVVREVLPETPAAEAGVQPGWIVVARNGVLLSARVDFHPGDGEVAGWDFLDGRDQAVALRLRARRLSTAARQISRELEGGFIYLRFDEFDGTDRRWLARQLRVHAAAPGVVVDLRFNPGGETFSLGIVIGEFFDRGVSCGTFITRSGSRDVKNSWQLGSANYRGRVVVLVDGGTGSAAEIFSAILQDQGRATLVGRKTAGAVLASWFHGLPDGGELQLSREDYLTPKGRRIEGNGVEPEVWVTRTLDDLRAGRDPDLAAALRVLGAAVVENPAPVGVSP
ncbi:MAG: hypothetical protein EXS38_03225 [Opitutus sp.]|nr:hypothetical protein [Opitutus sp.]